MVCRSEVLAVAKDDDIANGALGQFASFILKDDLVTVGMAISTHIVQVAVRRLVIQKRISAVDRIGLQTHRHCICCRGFSGPRGDLNFATARQSQSDSRGPGMPRKEPCLRSQICGHATDVTAETEIPRRFAQAVQMSA